eukprot:tig00000989_g6094.t1
MASTFEIAGESLTFVVRNYPELKEEEAGDGRPCVTFEPEEDALGQWKLLVCITGDGEDGSPEHLGAYLQWGEGAEFKTGFTIALLNQDPAKNVVRVVPADGVGWVALEAVPTQQPHRYGFWDFALVSAVADPAAGFLFGGDLRFLVVIEPGRPRDEDEQQLWQPAEAAEAELAAANWRRLAEDAAAVAAYQQRRAEAAEWALVRAERARAESAAAAERAQADAAALRHALDETEPGNGDKRPRL